MADNVVISLKDRDGPVELDRIYAGLRDLSETLGPNGVNKDGTLDHLLAVANKNLGGQGKKGNDAIRSLSEAAETFGDGSGDLVRTVRQPGDFPTNLTTHHHLVGPLMKDPTRRK